jgi:hypothetical protein
LEIRSKFGNKDEEELVDVNEESSGTQDLSTEPLDSDVNENYQNKRKNIRKMFNSSYLV